MDTVISKLIPAVRYRAIEFNRACKNESSQSSEAIGIFLGATGEVIDPEISRKALGIPNSIRTVPDPSVFDTEFMGAVLDDVKTTKSAMEFQTEALYTCILRKFEDESTAPVNLDQFDLNEKDKILVQEVITFQSLKLLTHGLQELSLDRGKKPLVLLEMALVKRVLNLSCNPEAIAYFDKVVNKIKNDDPTVERSVAYLNAQLLPDLSADLCILCFDQEKKG